MHGCYLNPRRHALKALEEAVQGASWAPRAGPLQFSIYLCSAHFKSSHNRYYFVTRNSHAVEA